MALGLSRNTLEIIVGGVATALFAAFVAFVFTINQKNISGYRLIAVYNHIDGLPLQADVRLAGIRVGEVVGERFDPAHYQAVVTMTIEDGVAIPEDSAAVIATDGILGGKFIKIDPGGDTEMLKPGGSFDYVQDSVDFEDLLKRVVDDAEARHRANRAKPAPQGG
ncbi:MAG TPA: outer membrane lipid asymmetry maintenance protein MlaD [Alphaproteobacteria bacterium]|nr:outer membrane lipid asymmetry maintenance protein MlaD [Alphaproteobacteria bacterium]